MRDYLEDVVGVERKNLLEYSDSAPLELRAAVKEIWAEVHDRRRSEGIDTDPGTVERLIAHDIENSVGVMQIRRRTNDSPLGYRHWWLTLDRTAFHMTGKLRSFLGADAPVSPALSPDFLSQLLRIGPLRTAVERQLRVDLPLLSDFSRLDYTPRALIAAADELRGDSAGQSDRRVDREVRDRLDAMRATYGPGAFAAARVAEERVVKELQDQADNARLLA